MYTWLKRETIRRNKQNEKKVCKKLKIKRRGSFFSLFQRAATPLVIRSQSAASSRTENYKRARQVRKGVVSGTHGDVIVFFCNSKGKKVFQKKKIYKITSKFLSICVVPATVDCVTWKLMSIK